MGGRSPLPIGFIPCETPYLLWLFSDLENSRLLFNHPQGLNNFLGKRSHDRNMLGGREMEI